jgi:hypothetical protein
VAVEIAHQEFLAGAGFSQHEDSDSRWRDLQRLAVDRTHLIRARQWQRRRSVDRIAVVDRIGSGERPACSWRRSSRNAQKSRQTFERSCQTRGYREWATTEDANLAEVLLQRPPGVFLPGLCLVVLASATMSGWFNVAL